MEGLPLGRLLHGRTTVGGTVPGETTPCKDYPGETIPRWTTPGGTTSWKDYDLEGQSPFGMTSSL